MSVNEKYFKILGIKPTSDDLVIKKAYRRQALRYHPDKNKSEDAHYQFIKITEAYEIITGQRSEKTQKSNGFKPKSREEILAEKVALAKERWRRQQQEEAEKDAEYYKKIASGWKWRLFQICAVYAAFWSILLTTDYFLDGEEVCVTAESNPDFYARTTRVRGEKFAIEDEKYWQNLFANPPVKATYSYLFHDLKKISVVTNYFPKYVGDSHSSKMNEFDYFEHWELYHAMSFSSAYGAFPFLQAAFFIPLCLIIFRRPNLRFSLWRLVSVWIIYPTILFFTFSNDRIYHLIELMST